MRLRLQQRRRRRKPKYNPKLTLMTAATVTGLLASGLLAMWVSMGRFGLSPLPIYEVPDVLFWGNSIPNFSHSADTSWKSFGLSSYPL